MNKEKDIYKISNYDKFKCTADKCKFTCCSGWDVSIDSDTYNKWKDNDLKYILDNVKKCEDDNKYFIDKETHESCRLLDKQGLCSIVNNQGEEYLCLTCSMFPRVENHFEYRKELSLSCACPEVVENISNMDSKINMLSENNNDIKDDSLAFKIRDNLVKIVQQKNLLMEEKLIAAFQMLSIILENENISKDILVKEITKYEDKQHLNEVINMYRELESDIYDSIEEINNLFLDITENYKEVSVLKPLLEDISEFAEECDIVSLSERYNDYKDQFEKFDSLIENCIVSKILENCVDSEIEDITISFEMIILEYILVRHAVFLKCCIAENNEINVDDIKDYIVAFSRIIGNNAEAVIGFLKDGFGEAVIEIGYLCFITLF